MTLRTLVFLCLFASQCTKSGKGGKSSVTPSVTPTVMQQEGLPKDPVENLMESPLVNVNSFDCEKLDYGIYWFGKGDTARKAIRDTSNPFFDPGKPTFLYVHGWQRGSHILKRRSSFNYNKYEPFHGVDQDAADAWIASGWNVGIFYWNQFSDEDFPRQAEDKIWTENPISWKACGGVEKVEGVPPGDNATDLLYKSFVEAMVDYRGNNIRLAGHSLGNQMVTRLAERLVGDVAAKKLPAQFKPARVALIDPYWSAGNKILEGRGTLSRPIISKLKDQGVIFERYTTTSLAEGADRNLELTAMIGEVQLYPDWYSARNEPARHTAAPFLYFLSFGSPPPCATPCKDIGPSAATPDDRMRELMNGAVQWVQTKGRDTPETGDNLFERVQ